MTRVLVGAGVVFAACGMFGQSTTAPKAFEVASIKPNTSGTGNSSTHTSKGQIRMENVSLKQCIETAFDVKDYSLSGPSWLDNARFDILAKPPSASTPWSGFGLPPDFRAMLQALLADRFKLAVHRETRVVSAYALVTDKKGAKIQPVEEAGPSGMSSGRGLLAGTRVSMAQFADLLSGNLDRPVKDLTETKGVFDIKLRWTPDETQPAESDNPAAASLFAAVQEQLGLRLEARKLPIEILVVDHVEKVPTEN
jgi:uncharacterized protein (TIGR03435 family)